MQPRIRLGLIVGAIAAVLNICVAGFLGFCGPLVSIIAGGVAGYMATQQEKPLVKNEGARVGATAGGIAGAIVIVGQIIGNIAGIFLGQAMGRSLLGQDLPSGDMVQTLGVGIGLSLCLGIVGALLAAGAGAGAGYLATPDQAMTPPPPQNIIS